MSDIQEINTLTPGQIQKLRQGSQPSESSFSDEEMQQHMENAGKESSQPLRPYVVVKRPNIVVRKVKVLGRGLKQDTKGLVKQAVIPAVKKQISSPVVQRLGQNNTQQVSKMGRTQFVQPKPVQRVSWASALGVPEGNPVRKIQRSGQRATTIEEMLGVSSFQNRSPQNRTPVHQKKGKKRGSFTDVLLDSRSPF